MQKLTAGDSVVAGLVPATSCLARSVAARTSPTATSPTGCLAARSVARSVVRCLAPAVRSLAAAGQLSLSFVLYAAALQQLSNPFPYDPPLHLFSLFPFPRPLVRPHPLGLRRLRRSLHAGHPHHARHTRNAARKSHREAALHVD